MPGIGKDIELSLTRHGDHCGLESCAGRTRGRRRRRCRPGSRLLLRPERRPGLLVSAMAGEVEGQAQIPHGGQINDVALAPDGLAAGVVDAGAAGRGIMAAGMGGLDDKSVDPPGGLPQQDGGEAGRRDDRVERRAVQFRRGGTHGGLRVEVERMRGITALAGDIEGKLGGFPGREMVENGRHLHGDARAHQDDINAGQHRAIERWQRLHLDLGQQVQADRTRMALFGEVDFGETARDAELVERRVVSEAWHHGGQEGRTGPCATLDEIAVEDRGSDST